MEHYSAIHKNEVMPRAAARMQLEIIILGEVSCKEKNNSWYYLHVGSEIWHKWTYLWSTVMNTENRLVIAKTEGAGEGWSDRLRWVNMSYYIQNG